MAIDMHAGKWFPMFFPQNQGNSSMHAKGFLHKILSSVIHKSRLKALSEVVIAAIKSKELVLTKMGRAIEGIQERSGIQKVNRLLGNPHLQSERKIISRAVSKLLTGNKKSPELIADWTKYPNSQDAVLRVSFSAQGRAITLYEERHSIKKMGNKKVQLDFLKTLKNEILPSGSQPIIVTDAGFHNDWFRAVLKQGWDYIGRIRGLKLLSYPGKGFKPCKNFFSLGTSKVKCLGKMIITKKNPLESNLYMVKKKLKGRKAFTKQGKVRRDKDSKAYSRAHREPWLLASSLEGRYASKKVKRIYSDRMTIEEGIRDLKSSRYGLGLEESKTREKERRDILLLIGMLASLIAWIMGKTGEEMKLHYQFQSNSIKHRRVISLFYLGCQLIRKKFQIPIPLIRKVIASLQMEAVYE
jgi:hypothetical protein